LRPFDIGGKEGVEGCAILDLCIVFAVEPKLSVTLWPLLASKRPARVLMVLVKLLATAT